MITLDEDGNLLSEPENYEEWKRDSLLMKNWYDDQEEYFAYYKALNQATEIVNCYEDKQED